jgi:hypothetical protein
VCSVGKDDDDDFGQELRDDTGKSVQDESEMSDSRPQFPLKGREEDSLNIILLWTLFLDSQKASTEPFFINRRH